MNWKIKSMFSTVFSFSILCIFPFLMLKLLPQELALLVEISSLNLTLFLNEIILLGVVVSVFSFFKIFFEETSFIHLFLKLIPNCLWLVSSMFFLGQGNIESFGIIPVSFELNNANFTSNSTVFDLRFFAYFFIIISFLNVIHLVLDFKQKRNLFNNK